MGWDGPIDLTYLYEKNGSKVITLRLTSRSSHYQIKIKIITSANATSSENSGAIYLRSFDGGPKQVQGEDYI